MGRSQMQFLYFSFLEIYKTEGVRQLLLDQNERLLNEFVPKLIIFRAMLHLNKIIDAKKNALMSKKIDKNNLFENVQDKRIDFGKLSAKENRFELPKSTHYSKHLNTTVFDFLTKRTRNREHRPTIKKPIKEPQINTIPNPLKLRKTQSNDFRNPENRPTLIRRESPS
jgi:hypothetical protein